METCDVLVVGGGPAGSTCAGKLRQAGIDVLLMDKETFPRDKPCAGWITPEVLTTLSLEPEEYSDGRVLQEIGSFRTGLINGTGVVTRYGKTVSYGIRRCEFDHFLLQRSGVRQLLGTPVATLARHDGWWYVNGRIRARLVVGAGGHFCPVARFLGAHINREDVIVAQVAELAISPEPERICHTAAEMPALYFCRDMKGYGWLLRKGGVINIGLGRQDREHLGRHMRDFCAFLVQRGVLESRFACKFRGHAYLLYEQQGGRTCVGDGMMLIGDAAGLAYPQSGEGILPAIESAILAADTILAANGDYQRADLEPYVARLATRFGSSKAVRSSPMTSGLLRFLGAGMLSSSWFTRHVLLNRWFLHANQKELRQVMESINLH